ncbi:MAG TPA: alpha/beta hydrolase [Solirubrobacterales bacterium]|nr:alpha/beta hydrolase [Solirubrobacterales bacterium]
MDRITSADGTEIACEVSGDGPALILVGGALTDRAAQRPLAEELSDRLSVINFDRRGRGDSGANGPVDPAREVEDIAALIEAVGGTASVYGHSSGAGLALRAGAAGIGIERLILHEPPYTPDGETAQMDGAKAFNRDLTAILAEGRHADAVGAFMSVTGTPEEIQEALRRDPSWDGYVAMAGSLAWDSAAMGDADGGTVPHELVAKVSMPTLILEGTETFPFMIEVGRALAAELPDATLAMLEGQHHEPAPELFASDVVEFVRA